MIPTPDATVNSGPDAGTFPQELINYSEEVSSQSIPPVVYINGSTMCRNQQTGVSLSKENSENSRNSLNPRVKQEQTHEQGPLSQRYTEPLVQGTAAVNSPTLQEYWDEDFSKVTSIQHGINTLSFNP